MITHPEKVLFPDDGISKGELARYYEAVAPFVLPHLRGRPVTMERYPAGIGKKGFIQKDVAKGYPEWLERVEVPKKDGSSFHALIADERALAWMANQNCVTPHVWAARVPDLLHPDLCVFDLDPSEDDPPALRSAALDVRELLASFGLPSWVKTSGSKGFHIVVPLDGAADFLEASRFSYGCGVLLVKRQPLRWTQEFIKRDREGRIFIDTGRNHYGATYAAAYAVRPRSGAPVSAPCTWKEIEDGLVTPQHFTLRTMSQRLDLAGELWSDLHANPCALAGPLAKLESLLEPEDWQQARAASVRKPKARKRAQSGGASNA